MGKINKQARDGDVAAKNGRQEINKEEQETRE